MTILKAASKKQAQGWMHRLRGLDCVIVMDVKPSLNRSDAKPTGSHWYTLTVSAPPAEVMAALAG